ncbi:MAG: HAMP domain-containing sensor histidine kinase [Rhodocyclaceae bacterium]|nr:HAMP domain-containing sensor histidine kinase [Accumulibacter sp.]HNJ76214.1 HAMP domain-containing sensor histidine kinase [Azospira sp.]HNN08128.1 HAMP domain-containing sensor histidine kinase [Azospira sp.]
MPRFHSLHAKILFGYCLLGLLFVALIVSALLQFRKLETKVNEQQSVADFHDEIRYSRRMEKNYLLYRKNGDLAESIERANNALGLIKQLPPRLSDSEVQVDATELLERYRALLIEMANADRFGKVSSEVTDELLITGSRLLSIGEKLDSEARDLLEDAVAKHHRNLQYTILAAILLAIAAGVLVTRSVVKPLRTIETSLGRVATGETGRLDQTADDLEVGSLTQAINRTLSELDERQKVITRSSRLVALGTMLSGVAHELNNPLSNISTSCQILLEEHDDLPPEMCHDLLAQIDGEVLRAQRIVSTLLDFAREKQYDRHPTPARQLVEEVLQLTRSLTPPDATITTDVGEDLLIDVDRQRFQQVLINLLQNAADVVGPGGRIHIDARRENNGTRISVADNGPGIAPEDLPRIFDPFFSTKAVGKGTGLGLFIVHEIIGQHGGTISVDSQPGQGTRFSIHIPDQKKPENLQ